MVAYAGDRQPIYMPRFGFYVAPRPTNKQSILILRKRGPAAFFAVRASCDPIPRYQRTPWSAACRQSLGFCLTFP